jgi:hypothetical protein
MGEMPQGRGGLGRAAVDGGPAPLVLTAAHEPTGIPRALWARWGSPRSIKNKQVIEARA